MTRTRRPATSQIDLFPVSAHFRRIRPERNEWRFYSLSIQPELFGGAVLVRQWGRIGTKGTQRLDLHPDEGAAVNALADQILIRRRRGYAAA